MRERHSEREKDGQRLGGERNSEEGVRGTEMEELRRLAKRREEEEKSKKRIRRQKTGGGADHAASLCQTAMLQTNRTESTLIIKITQLWIKGCVEISSSCEIIKRPTRSPTKALCKGGVCGPAGAT